MERGVGKELARSAAGAAAAHHLASAMRRHVALGHGVVVGSLRVCECCNRELADFPTEAEWNWNAGSR